MNVEDLRGNKKMNAIKPLIEEINKNKKSTVIIEKYGAEDYWHEKESIIEEYYNVENACRTWTRTIHPHEGSHSHSLTLIREGIGDTIQLYTIKNIEVKAE